MVLGPKGISGLAIADQGRRARASPPNHNADRVSPATIFLHAAATTCEDAHLRQVQPLPRGAH
eukprot:542064-Heterocapsa_arctica.AAC.1